MILKSNSKVSRDTQSPTETVVTDCRLSRAASNCSTTTFSISHNWSVEKYSNFPVFNSHKTLDLCNDENHNPVYWTSRKPAHTAGPETTQITRQGGKNGDFSALASKAILSKSLREICPMRLQAWCLSWMAKESPLIVSHLFGITSSRIFGRIMRICKVSKFDSFYSKYHILWQTQTALFSPRLRC